MKYDSVFISHAKIAQVSRIIIHPLFSLSTLSNDIAILHIKQIDLTSDRTKSICLPEIDDDPHSNTMLTISGWGKVNNSCSYSPTHLMAVDVPVIQRNHCDKLIKEYQIKIWNTTQVSITKEMFCAGYEQGKKDSCTVRCFQFINNKLFMILYFLG